MFESGYGIEMMARERAKSMKKDSAAYNRKRINGGTIQLKVINVFMNVLAVLKQ